MHAPTPIHFTAHQVIKAIDCLECLPRFPPVLIGVEEKLPQFLLRDMTIATDVDHTEQLPCLSLGQRLPIELKRWLPRRNNTDRLGSLPQFVSERVRSQIHPTKPWKHSGDMTTVCKFHRAHQSATIGMRMVSKGSLGGGDYG